MRGGQLEGNFQLHLAAEALGVKLAAQVAAGAKEDGLEGLSKLVHILLFQGGFELVGEAGVGGPAVAADIG